MTHGLMTDIFSLLRPITQSSYTYSFATALGSGYHTGYSASGLSGAEYVTASSDFFDASAAMGALMSTATTRFGAVSGVAIAAATTGPGDIEIYGVDQSFVRMGSGAASAAAFTPLPGAASHASDIFFGNGIKTNSAGANQRLLEHEMLHAVGIDDIPSTFGARDNARFSLLSSNGSGTTPQLSSELQLYDIGALQALYGASSQDSGNTVHSSFTDGSGAARMFSIFDSGGHDSINVSSAEYATLIDLRPGYFSSISVFGNVSSSVADGAASVSNAGAQNISLAFGTYMEDAVGTAHDDVIIGNRLTNVISGGEGKDIIYGDGEDSVYDAGAGDYRQITNFNSNHYVDAPTGVKEFVDDKTKQSDEIHGGKGDDFIVGSAGNDFLYGDDDNDILKGGAGDDTLMGGDGNDLLDGGQGTDTFYGGAGDDILIVSSTSAAYLELDGGSGADQYWFMPASTYDESREYDILTSDADDRLFFNGYALEGGTLTMVDYEVDDGVPFEYLSYLGDNGVVYDWMEGWEDQLWINLPDGTWVYCHDFTNGDFGITLPFAVGLDDYPTATNPMPSLPYSSACNTGEFIDMIMLAGRVGAISVAGPSEVPTMPISPAPLIV